METHHEMPQDCNTAVAVKGHSPYESRLLDLKVCPKHGSHAGHTYQPLKSLKKLLKY